MFLCITFAGESVPFVMNDADEICLMAIEACKKEFSFNRQTAVVRTDYIFLEALPKKKTGNRRLYIHNDMVVLETDARHEGEIEETKRLLAYERNCEPGNIQCIEI